ncbi:hypothetical protein N657DRAFT_694528 [Parathielavia appendiculata]|uniref:Conserved oligomeric Golgi complex subunit 5 n=1 Tax=Parathielavia appendiculata TaxID=2587402 RepID=A0AAN6YYI2_9PEZI|nr:hypothetical protein N657DRAFT_694528 [Parathielavia appendiculata]
MSAPMTPTAPAADEPSYIDYEAFLDPSFSPSSFANTLVLATNNPSDTPLDLSTPLSRVLFDIQEIDSHIDLLTTRSALPLLTHTQSQTAASANILTALQSQITALNESYAQLEREVTHKHAEADEVRNVASRLWTTLRLGRAVGRCLQLGRQLEAQHTELAGSVGATATTSAASARVRVDHRALVRCAHTLLALREMFAGTEVPGAEGFGLDKVTVVRGLREGVVMPIERAVKESAERIVREFSVGSASGAATFAQSEEVKARTVSALTALYLLTPVPGKSGDKWAPTWMLQALEVYLKSALQSSIAGLSRALATLPSLERTLAEVSARCQNVVALEAVLESTKAPEHPLLQGKQAQHAGGNMLQPLLAHLETGSLASYFWRTMAGSMAPRVQEIVAKGGVSARTLKTNRQSVGEAIKDCVAKGSQLPSAVAAAAKGKGKGKEAEATGKHWEREVAVMRRVGVPTVRLPPAANALIDATSWAEKVGPHVKLSRPGLGTPFYDWTTAEQNAYMWLLDIIDNPQALASAFNLNYEPRTEEGLRNLALKEKKTIAEATLWANVRSQLTSWRPRIFSPLNGLVFEKGRFTHSFNRRPTKEHSIAMQKAKQNLDEFRGEFDKAVGAKDEKSVNHIKSWWQSRARARKPRWVDDAGPSRAMAPSKPTQQELSQIADQLLNLRLNDQTAGKAAPSARQANVRKSSSRGAWLTQAGLDRMRSTKGMAITSPNLRRDRSSKVSQRAMSVVEMLFFHESAHDHAGEMDWKD